MNRRKFPGSTAAVDGAAHLAGPSGAAAGPAEAGKALESGDWGYRWLMLSAGLLFSVVAPPPARAYITYPVATLGKLCDSTYVTEVRVDSVSKEKGVIVYRKVKDLKGKYPRDTIRHVFDLKNTPP